MMREKFFTFRPYQPTEFADGFRQEESRMITIQDVGVLAIIAMGATGILGGIVSYRVDGLARVVALLAGLAILASVQLLTLASVELLTP